MTKDKKELEALSGLCEENNVIMVRSFLPEEIRKKRRNLKSGILQYRGTLWAIQQVIQRVKYYRKRSKDKVGYDSLLKYLDNVRQDTQKRKAEVQKLLDNDFKSSNHKLNESDNSSVKENALGKLLSKSVKPIPINKQTMNIVDYKKGDIFIK